MTVYMVFEPPHRDEDRVARAERIAFVRDRFTWSAFLFAPLWMIAHRLWLVLAGYVGTIVVISVVLRVAGVAPGWRGAAIGLVGLLVGLEAASLRRWTLLRRGWRDLGTVIGDDLEVAERRFFDVYVANEPQAKVAPAALPPPFRPAPGAPDVIGLFPQPGGSR